MALLGNVDLFGVTYTRYQLFLIPAVALVSYLGLLFALRRTRLGKQIVAVAHHREVATALGINTKRIGLITFVTGAFFGALGGAIAAPTTSRPWAWSMLGRISPRPQVMTT